MPLIFKASHAFDETLCGDLLIPTTLKHTHTWVLDLGAVSDT